MARAQAGIADASMSRSPARKRQSLGHAPGESQTEEDSDDSHSVAEGHGSRALACAAGIRPGPGRRRMVPTAASRSCATERNRRSHPEAGTTPAPRAELVNLAGRGAVDGRT